MNLFHLPKLFWFCFMIGVLALIPAAYAAPIIGSEKCQLGETCRIGPFLGYIYYPVTSAAGTTYSCTIKATDDKKITVKFSSYEDFTFTSKQVSVGSEATKITLSGRFTGNNGAIKIRQIVGLGANGTVICNAGT